MFKILVDGCEPKRGTKYSACVDVFSSEDATIGAGETKLIGLGIAIDIDKLIEFEFANIKYEPYYQDHIDGFLNSHYLQLMLRSSLSKKGLILPNGVGIIDLDFGDEIKMIIHNPIQKFSVELSEDDISGTAMGDIVDLDVYQGNVQYIKKGDKIGQITLLEHKSYLFDINTDEERTGGFGSTDKGIK